MSKTKNAGQAKKGRSKAPSQNTSSSAVIRFFRQTAVLLLKVLCVLVLILLFYLVYLDSKISKKFSGQKWQVPAQIYARSTELLPGATISQQQLINQLNSLQYQRNAALSAPGQYSVSRNHVTVYRRSFTYINGFEAEQLFSVEFNRGASKKNH